MSTRSNTLAIRDSICFRVTDIGKRIGIITGLFDRKSEYRTRTIACLFYESLPKIP